MMMWLLDTLDCINRFPPRAFTIYLKGGTCVQHYLPHESQRFSIDLDFSTCFQEAIGIPEKVSAVKGYLHQLNQELLENGWMKNHGTFRIPSTHPRFSTICLCGRVFQPIKCPRMSSKALNIHHAAYIKTEFFLYDTNPEYANQSLSLVSCNYARRNVVFNLASKTRLLADKIIALSGEGYGARNENKDIIDLKALSGLDGVNLESAASMIAGWAQAHLDDAGRQQPVYPPVKIIHAAREASLAKSQISDRALAEMMGLLYARGRPGYSLRRDEWRKTCLQVADFLEEQMVPLFSSQPQ